MKGRFQSNRLLLRKNQKTKQRFHLLIMGRLEKKEDSLQTLLIQILRKIGIEEE